jgi:O-antigen/teichoic acid export membrane protein
MSATVVETRAAKAALASALSMGLSVVLQLVSVPVCLNYWGQQTYGLWLALAALTSLFRTLDSGFAAYVGNEINLQYHREPEAMRRTLASALWGALIVSAIELLGGAAIIFSGALALLLGVPEDAAREGSAGLAFAVLLIGYIVSTAPYLGVVNKLLVPAGMLHQATWWYMGLQIAQSAALVAAAAFKLSLPDAAVLSAGAMAATHLGSAIYIARKLPAFLPWWSRPSWSVGVRDLLRSTVMVGATLLSQAGASGMVMLVSGSFGAAALPAFTTVRTLASLWTTLCQVLTAPLLPDVVRYHAQREPAKLVAMFETHWLIANGVLNLSLLVALPFIDFAYHTWTSGKVALDPAFLCTMLLATVLATPGSLIVVYLVGINDLRAITMLYAVRGLAPLAAGLALMPWLGLGGAGAAVAIGEFLGPVVVGGLYFRRQLYRLDERASPRWQPAALGTGITAVLLIGRAWSGTTGWLTYTGALCAVLASVIWGWSGTDPEVRARGLRLLRRRSPFRSS